jgi:hypothetical protein
VANITDKLDWAHALEAADGIPSTPNTDQTLVDWAAAEGGAGPEFGVPGNVTNYNPINITLTSGPKGYGYDPGSGAYYAGASPTTGNDPPVASFSDWDTGIQATAARLRQPFAAGILADLQSNAPESSTAAAVGASGWGTGDFAGVSASGTAPATAGPGGATATQTGIIGDLFGGATSSITAFLSKAMLVMAGVGILILAAYKAASPVAKDVASKAAPAAELAAV